MLSGFIFWPCLAGAIFLVAGLFAVRREWSRASGLDKLIACGPLFFAVPLAVFGAEHLSGPRILMQVVPAWMPGRLFWAYFVGLAEIAAAVSLILRWYVRWSAPLLGAMFFLFVLLIHLPNVAANPRNRILWAVALRDLAFGGGAWALAGTQFREWKSAGRMVFAGRMCIAIPVIFFGIEQLLHPEFAPGVPLPKVTPAWVPLHAWWGYPVGAILLACGVAMLVNRQVRTAAAVVGLAMTLLCLFLYSPILAMARQPSAITEGLNYVADTLLFGGTALLLAGATVRGQAPKPAPF